jgi:hypothetical protein
MCCPTVRLLLSLSLVLALLQWGCSSDGSLGIGGGDEPVDTKVGPWWVCPPVKGAGLEHGKKCSSDAECMYGHCLAGSFLVNYSANIKFCSKNNNCAAKAGGSGASVDCSADNSSSAKFKSTFEVSKTGGNTSRTGAEVQKLCARDCTSDADCIAWNPEMPNCTGSVSKLISTGAKVCARL